MKFINHILLALFISLSFSTSTSLASGTDPQPEVTWIENFKEAKTTAKSENKYMLLDFTGSDWCGWCIKLKDEVFKKSAFKAYASESLVLVELDFPRGKKQSNKIKEQNERLAREYGIRGFPTILILDPNGKLVGKTGYQAGGPEKYVQHIKDIIKSSQN